MTTKTTELAAQLTADGRGLFATFERAQREVRELSKVTQDTSRASAAANQKVADSFDLTADKARKAASGVTGVSQALFALQSEGSTRVLALGSAVSNVAELFGPTGALVTGIGVAASAIAALFLQAREEAKRTAISVQNEIRSLSSSKDLGGLSRRQAQLFSGDRDFPIAPDNASPSDKLRARGIGELGGLLGIEPKIKAAREEVQKLEQAFRAANQASAAVSAPGTGGVFIGGDQLRQSRAALEELQAAQRLLRAEYDETTRRVEQLTPKLVGQTQTAIELAAATKKAADAERESARANAERREELERTAKAIEESMLRSAGRAIDEAQRQITGLLDKQDRQRKTVEETEKAELKLAVTRKENVEALRDELEAAEKGKEVYAEFLRVREREAFIEAALQESRELAAKKETTLTEKQISDIRERAAETFDLRTQIDGLTDAFARGDAQVESLAEGLSKAASAAAGLALAFGESGRQVSALLGQTAQLLTNISRAKKAGVFTGEDGKQQDVGFLGAIGGKAGSSGIAAAASSVLGIVGAVGAVAGALSAFGEKAKQRAAEIAAATKAFNEGIATFRDRALGQESQVGASLQAAQKEFKALLDEAAKKNGGFATLKDQVELSRLLGEDQARIARDFFGSIEDTLASLGGDESAGQLRQLENQTREREASIRALLEAGVIGADEAESSLAKVREIFKLTKQQIEDAAAAAAAARARAAEAFGLDLTAREQTLSGDKRGAFVTRQQISSANALQQARELMESGTITSEMFERLAKILDAEVAEALKEFDDAAEAATRRIKDDIAVRTLEAQGRTEEAAALRQEIADREELRSITDDALRAEIEQLQEIERAAREVAEQMEQAAEARDAARTNARNRVDLFDLEGNAAFEEILSGYGRAFADLFASFDLTTVDGIRGAKEQLRAVFNELADLTDAEILEKFGMTRDEITSALIQTDSGLEGLAGTLKQVADEAKAAAQATADFLDTLENDYLRSQGKNREADERAARTKRDARIAQAQALKLGAEVLDQIEAIYEADLAEIAARFATASAAPPVDRTPTAADTPVISGAGRTPAARRSNTSVVGDFGGLSEVTGQSLAGLLREIAINTSERGAIVAVLRNLSGVPSLSSLRFPSFASPFSGGAPSIVVGPITVNINGATAAGLQEMASSTGAAIAREVAKEMGRLAAAEARFLGSSVV